MESPLRKLDASLDAFATCHQMKLTKNYKEWPERSLCWGEEMERQIQVLLGDEEGLRFNVWIAAWQDREDGRYWKRASLANVLSIEEIQMRLDEILENGREALDSWSEEDLVRRGS
jgi:hypothetical protein